MKHLTIILAFLMTLSSPVAAQDFDKGLAAYEAGDYGAAVKEWKPLAEQGNVAAQYNLGIMYSNGQGVIQDYKEAVKWYKLAAEQGHTNAQYNLAVMYDDGQGVLQDDREAIKWYKLAAEQGDAKSQNALGWIYHLGRGVPQDYQEAIKWYRLAAEQGSGRYQSQLGSFYEGLARNNNDMETRILSHMWSNIAGANGYPAGSMFRDAVANHMTPVAIERAQTMARECMSSNYKKCGYYRMVERVDRAVMVELLQTSKSWRQ